MRGPLTLDASVFVAACQRREPHHVASRALLTTLRDLGTPLIEPAVLPVEIAAAIRRVEGSADRAIDIARAVTLLPRLTLVAVDQHLSERATDLAARHRLRGADALYAATALLYGARLVTLDHEQLTRSPSGVSAARPEVALAEMKPTIRGNTARTSRRD